MEHNAASIDCMVNLLLFYEQIINEICIVNGEMVIIKIFVLCLLLNDLGVTSISSYCGFTSCV